MGLFGRLLSWPRLSDLRPQPDDRFDEASLEAAIGQALSHRQGARRIARPVSTKLVECTQSTSPRVYTTRTSSDIGWYWLFWYHGCLPPEALPEQQIETCGR